MAKKSQTALDNELRVKYTEKIMEFLLSIGEDAMRIGSNQIGFPVVDDERNEKAIVITIKVPKGDWEKDKDGNKILTPYDVYSAEKAYQIDLQEKADRDAKANEAKRKKIAQDEAFRKKQAELKAKKAERAEAD